MAADAWGIEDGYWDVQGTWHPIPPETDAAIREVMGDDGSAERPPDPPPLWFVRQGDDPPLAGPAEVELEDGTTIRSLTRLLPDLPLGYHRLHPLDGGPTTELVISPARCPEPPGPHAWGWAVQAYAVRSAGSWGIGDLGDLRELGAWAAGLGARVLLTSPLHAPAPVLPQQASPYYPSSRLARNVLHLRIEHVPGAGSLGEELDGLARAGRALNAERHIDRDAAYQLKLHALERLWPRFRDAAGGEERAAFERFVAEQGEELQRWAVACTIAEHHGAGFGEWPEELRHPAHAGVAHFAAAHADRVRFHAWVQWLLDVQLAAAGSTIGLISDLAVGFDPGGADAWAWQDALALGYRIGAPPDDFARDGQDWGLPPFVPWKLRAANYRPFVATVRAALRHAGGLRVDHVMGLSRLFWVPPAATPAEGAYVRYPLHDLLDIVALEATRAGAFVVGEDLGTVEDELREQLTERHVLSYRLLWFEPGPPATWPRRAMAAVTTHDLPTLAGVASGADLAAQERMGLEPRAELDEQLRDKLAETAGGDLGDLDQTILAVHRALGSATSVLVCAALDDALGVEERPNHPGTVDAWPNWSIALPAPLDAITADPRVRMTAEAVAAGRAEATRRDAEQPAEEA